MNKELIEILRELEKKRIPEICNFKRCADVYCAHCFMYAAKLGNFNDNKYLPDIFSISL